MPATIRRSTAALALKQAGLPQARTQMAAVQTASAAA